MFMFGLKIFFGGRELRLGVDGRESGRRISSLELI